MTLPGRPRWYHHIEPVSASLECEGARHRVSWQRGKFVLHDHDLSSERAMLVLGGEPSPCLRALRMWRDQFGMPPEIFLQMHTWLGDNAVLAPTEMDLPRQLGMTLSWARSWRHWRYLDKHGGLLQARATELALPLFKQHLLIERQRFGTRVISSAKVTIVPDTDVVGVTGRMDKVRVAAAATLHPAWLVEVWPRGFAVVDGAFVIEVVTDSRNHPLVRAVRWDDREAGMRKPVSALARLGMTGEGEWGLTWERSPTS
ncbi:MAG TPA: hypothetical protein VHS52_02340 [Acidimicrobiales bacterium]|nr:hypothetical protein [Acidimicrobiales bacterium]